MHVRLKISKYLFAINQLKNSLPKCVLLNLYNALIKPYLTYGIQLWGNAKSTHLGKLVQLQKRAIRTVQRSSYNSHTSPLFKQSNELNLHDLYIYHVLLSLKYYRDGKLPPSFLNMFMLNKNINETHKTRQSDLYHIKVCKNEFSKNLPLIEYPYI